MPGSTGTGQPLSFQCSKCHKNNLSFRGTYNRRTGYDVILTGRKRKAGGNSHGLTEDQRISAASLAAYNHLSFVAVSGYSTDTEHVVVHVDGYGECTVAIGEDHD